MANGRMDYLNSKTKKYDRQLRLWGDHGQIALEAAKVCLINANATGTEILKNLVLPGVGSFTVIDSGFITHEDIGVNFFLTKESLGKSKAEVTTSLLKELNPDVVGIPISDPLDVIVENSLDFFNKFDLVVASSLPERSLTKLSALLWDVEVPLMICRSYGFIGYLRLVVKEHTVVETHPESLLEDLRLDVPFPGLEEYCNNVRMDGLSLRQHSHIPWLVVLFKEIQKWREFHHGKLPENYKEKNELKELIRKGRMLKSTGVYEDEENFDEAVRNVNTALVPSRIPKEIQELFKEENCINLHYESKPFWILVRALKEFTETEGNGSLPLRGTIPDMTSDTEHYIGLQKVYREQAGRDVSQVSGHVQRLLQTLGRDEPLNVKKTTNPSPTSSPARPEDCITEEDISLFCKNAKHLRFFGTKSFVCDPDRTDHDSQFRGFCVEDSDDDELVYIILLRCSDIFYSEYNRYPGSQDEMLEDDFSLFKTCVLRVCQDMGLSSTIKDDYMHEFCRQGAIEIHSVAAFMGGIAAQEAIKLITHQFLPINNVFVYNAMKQTSKSFCF